jgi:nucleoside-diphosphate-sugar epimerase/ubiquinone/menaquinone biosynthesis C-methylase UbiE
MNVLITGGGGFIGSHLVESQLRQGHRVRTVDRHVDGLAHLAERPTLEIVAGDLIDAALVARLVEGIDCIYHLASAHLEVSLPDTRYWQVNVEATVNLLRTAHAAGVRRVVHCSSVGVFGDIATPPADETTPCHPTNIYELTKLAGERVALRFANIAGLSVVVARPAWVYGPRCPRTRKLLRSLKKRRFVMVGDGQTLRHPIYIADAVAGLEACAAAEHVAGQVFILAGPRVMAVETLVQTAAQVVGAHPLPIRLPLALAKIVGVTLQAAAKPLGREPPFSRRSVDFFLKDNAYATSKAQSELGFRAQVDLHEGFAETWQWLSQQKETHPMNSSAHNTVAAVREYWNAHTLGTQYASDKSLPVGSPEFFAHIRPWMNPYKFPWIMERIEREAALLQGAYLLEIGCGMGFDSLEFLKRGVRVTATDLTPRAAELARRHFEIASVQAEDVRVENVLDLSFPDNTFDAVWANGVLHATGDTALAIREVRRVLKPGGRAIISHFYRRPSWMYWLSRFGRENIEFKEQDPPVNEFYTERQILAMFEGFRVVETAREHYRALPVARSGLKAALYERVFRPAYNCLPGALAKRLAYKLSVTAIKQ